MALRKHEPVWTPGEPDPVPLTADVERAMAAPSPARALQRLLDEHPALRGAPDVGEERWSRRRTLAFVVTSSAVLWLTIIAAGMRVAALVA